MHKRERTKSIRIERRNRAAAEYQRACEWAGLCGLALLQITDDQYQIKPLDGGWCADIHVGRRRINSYGSTPRIKVPDEFQLYDIVTKFKRAM